MLLTYLKSGVRNILKYKAFSFINLLGLALGMSTCMLIILMVIDQNEYDQFHQKKNMTYRILSQRKQSIKPNGSSPFPLAATLQSDYTIVQQATTLTLGVGGDAVYNGKSVEGRGFFADSAFFKIFDFELENGNRAAALNRPNSIVLSHAFARNLFGGENALGKTIEFVDRGLDIISFGNKESNPVSWGTFVVTGVLGDKDYKSHLKFDVLISTSSMKGLYEAKKIEDVTTDWETYSRAYTYVTLLPEKTSSELAGALNDIVGRRYKDIDDLKDFKLIEQKLTEITPGMFVGNPTRLSLPIEFYYFLAALGIVVMLSACLNYIYLCTARSMARAKEIGVRKVVGAQRKSLIFQFLTEALLTSFLALVLASVLLFVFLRSAFLNLWVNQYLNFSLQLNFSVVILFIMLSVVIALIAGSYPALKLSRYQPIVALKGIEVTRVRNFRAGMKRMLNISQFVISLFFIVTSILIFRQFKHFLEFKYEFTSDNLVNISLKGNDYEVLANELSKVPGVMGVSGCSFVPATGMAHGAQIRKAGSQEDFTHAEILSVDENFLANLNLQILAGKNIQPQSQSAENFAVVNEATVSAMGYQRPSEIIGESLDRGGETIVVIGVVENFRFQTPMMQDKIGPLLLKNDPGNFDFVNVRIASENVLETISGLEKQWKRLDPIHTFDYTFFDEELKNVNKPLGDVVSIISYISVLAIVIACLGLLGMTIYTVNRREKEVCIRKVLGANDSNILFLLSSEFIKLMSASLIVSVPITFLFNQAWLESFPNKVEFGAGTILLGCFVVISFAALTIASQTIRASRRKPIDGLRVE